MTVLLPTGKEINCITKLEKRIKTNFFKTNNAKYLLIRLPIRTFNQLGLDQVFYKG